MGGSTTIASTVTYPTDGSPFIPGLQFRQGWLCAVETCGFRTASQDLIQRHCSKTHQTDVRRKQKEQKMYQAVMLQCFFAKAEQYWIVQRELASSTRLDSPRTSIPSSSVMSIRSNAATPSRPSHTNMVDTLAASAESAIKEDEGRYRQLGEPNHVSEITPWLRKSKFHEHLAGLDSDAVATSHLTPRREDDDARLYEVVWSIERVLHKAYQLVPDLLHVDARVLNTFQAGTTSQDPFQWLQNKSSFVNYIAVFQALICYYIRVFEGHFEREMFITSDSQRDSLMLALGVCDQLVQGRKGEDGENASVVEADHVGAADEPSQPLATLELELDHHMFNFCVALVQHKIKKAYDSAMLSFLAARSALVNREDETITFRPEAQVAGMLSKLIYCCQLVLLQDAHHIQEYAQLEDIEEPLQQLCQQWLVNNTRGPVAVMGDWRLYTMHVGGAFIPEALVVWDADGKNLTYGDIRYGIQDLVSEIGTALREAKRIFHEQLCLGPDDVPTFPLQELQDNWSNNQPGHSFVKDPRNAVYFEGCSDWLLRHIASDSVLLDAVFHTEQHEFDESVSWPVRSEFAKQFECFDEEFKEVLMVLLHSSASGSPAALIPSREHTVRSIRTDGPTYISCLENADKRDGKLLQTQYDFTQPMSETELSMAGSNHPMSDPPHAFKRADIGQVSSSKRQKSHYDSVTSNHQPLQGRDYDTVVEDMRESTLTIPYTNGRNQPTPTKPSERNSPPRYAWRDKTLTYDLSNTPDPTGRVVGPTIEIHRGCPTGAEPRWQREETVLAGGENSVQPLHQQPQSTLESLRQREQAEKFDRTRGHPGDEMSQNHEPARPALGHSTPCGPGKTTAVSPVLPDAVSGTEPHDTGYQPSSGRMEGHGVNPASRNDLIDALLKIFLHHPYLRETISEAERSQYERHKLALARHELQKRRQIDRATLLTQTTQITQLRQMLEEAQTLVQMTQGHLEADAKLETILLETERMLIRRHPDATLLRVLHRSMMQLPQPAASGSPDVGKILSHDPPLCPPWEVEEGTHQRSGVREQAVTMLDQREPLTGDFFKTTAHDLEVSSAESSKKVHWDRKDGEVEMGEALPTSSSTGFDSNLDGRRSIPRENREMEREVDVVMLDSQKGGEMVHHSDLESPVSSEISAMDAAMARQIREEIIASILRSDYSTRNDFETLRHRSVREQKATEQSLRKARTIQKDTPPDSYLDSTTEAGEEDTFQDFEDEHSA